MRRLSSVGTRRIVLGLVCAIVAIIGVTGFMVYRSQQTTEVPVVSQNVAPAATVDTAPAQQPELEVVDNTLVQTDQELETSLDTSALDEDINALL